MASTAAGTPGACFVDLYFAVPLPLSRSSTPHPFRSLSPTPVHRVCGRYVFPLARATCWRRSRPTLIGPMFTPRFQMVLLTGSKSLLLISDNDSMTRD